MYTCPTLFAYLPRRIPSSPQLVSTLNRQDPETLFGYIMTFIKVPDISRLICSFLPVIGNDGSHGQLLYGWRMLPKLNDNFILVLDQIGFSNPNILRLLSQARHFGVKHIFILTSYKKQAPHVIRTNYTHEKYVK
jgi:hypothetical protein